MTTSFGSRSTTDDVLSGVDLTGTYVLVTGISSGLGLETARAAASHGATVVGMARDLDKARRALEPDKLFSSAGISQLLGAGAGDARIGAAT